VDFFDIDVAGAVATVGAQETLNRCFLGQQNLCDNITRDANGVITYVTSRPFNLNNLHQRGLDIEASYNTELSSLLPVLSGNLELRALGTHVMFSKRDDGVNRVQDFAGDNSGQGPLNWRWLFTSTYSLESLTVAWTGRSLSSGHYNPSYVECAASCQPSSPNAQTIDRNYIAGRFYHDLSLSYRFKPFGAVQGQVFLNVINVADKMPPPVASAQYWYMPTNPFLYDTIGRSFYAGVRFNL
jgi:hypothetical protein